MVNSLFTFQKTCHSDHVHPSDVMGLFRAVEIVLIVLSCAYTIVFALPASPPLTSAPSGLLYQSSNISLSRPPSPAACSDSMGVVTKSDCVEAIKLLPHDPPMRPILRNFYTDPSDVSPAMPNQQVPFEKTYGRHVLTAALRMALLC